MTDSLKNRPPGTRYLSGKKEGIFFLAAIFFKKIEDTVLVSLLIGMIGLAVVQIFLRNGMDAGILWGDSLIRVLVLWIGLAGAMAASRNDNHIRIDVISRYLPSAAKQFTTLFIHLFTAGVTFLLAWHSFVFVRMEMADGYMAFGRVPAWACESIIPIAFLVMCLRYTAFCADHLMTYFSSNRP